MRLEPGHLQRLQPERRPWGGTVIIKNRRNQPFGCTFEPKKGVKEMDFSKFTVKSQEAMQAAQTKAIRYGHLEVDGEHLLLVLMEPTDGLVPRLLQKLGVPLEVLRSRVEQELERKPRVSGPGAEAGKVYITQRLNQLLVKAEDEAKRLKDEYVSVEHILLAFIEEGGATAAGKMLREFGISRDQFLKTLMEIRGHQR